MQPLQIISQQNGKIMQLAAQGFGQIGLRGELAEHFGRELPLLQLAQFQAQLAREARQPRAGVKDLQLLAPPRQQRVQHHDASVFGQERRLRLAGPCQHEFGQTLKGKNLQARVTLQIRIRQELPFQLEGGLFGRQQNERRPVRFRQQRLANFRQAAESFPRPGRTEQKARMHPAFVAQNQPRAKIYFQSSFVNLRGKRAENCA